MAARPLYFSTESLTPATLDRIIKKEPKP